MLSTPLVLLLAGLLAFPGAALGDGALDPTFDGDGRVVTTFGTLDEGRSVALQADGKIVAVGLSGYPQANSDFALARYNPNGSLDPSFDGHGRVVTDFGSYDVAYGVAIQADGRIVAAGECCGGYYFNDFALARYNPNGSLDPSFGGDGRVQTDFGGYGDAVADVAIQADAKIVAAGGCCRPASGAGPEPPNFALARYNPDGSLDPSFDGDGRVKTYFGADVEQGEAAAGVAIQTDCKVVAAGWTEANYDFALARYTSTGTTLPKISLNDVTRFEGNGGITAYGFKVTLSSQSAQTVTVSAQTANGSASAPADYIAVGPTTVEFAPCETTKTVIVKVKSDLAREPDEGFFLKLSNPSGATIADGQGKGTIQNDDLSSSASCTITGTSAAETLNGTAANDVICAGGGNDRLYGLDGNDVLKGEGGGDLLVGGNGYDLLLGASGADQGQGGAGNDTLWGGDQADTLTGGINSDALLGEVGPDSLNTKDSASANDRANGGADSDSCTVDSGDIVVSCP